MLSNLISASSSHKRFSLHKTRTRKQTSIRTKSSPLRGMLDMPLLEQMVQQGEIETVIVAFTDHNGKLMGKRYDPDFFLEEGAYGSHCCDYLLTIDTEQNIVPGFKFTNWETGYGDFHLKPDMNTLRVCTWLDKTAIVLCDILDKKQELIDVAPRSILRKQIERANKLNLDCFGASELEYYLYKTNYRDAREKDYREKDLIPTSWYLEDYSILQGTREEFINAKVRKHLRNSGVPVENSKGEYGHGQHELNVKFTDILTMADRHVIYKQCFKEVAEQEDCSVTFMAKPHTTESGSSCHVHMSMWNKSGGNAFLGSDKISGLECSDVFRHFLGGWIKHTPEIMPFIAPTINSYKRYQAASWAPTKMAWSSDNRTAGFRVIGSGNGFRIECRIPGADVNPYLVFSGLLAAGLDGIEKKIEAPEEVKGDLYSMDSIDSIPVSLESAVDRFKNSEFAINSFGADVVEHYSHSYLSEVAAYNKAVTDWERKRYFEHI